MKKTFICSRTLLALCGALALGGVALHGADYSSLVNPFIGTGGHGHTFPAATYPFGMVQAGPDTRLRDWDGCSGYHYSDSVILGFTHTHLSGTGCLDWGDILLMPVVDETVASPFSHSREDASPGYYHVFLDHQKVDVSIACGRRCAMHQYVFPSAALRDVVVDLHHRDRLTGCFLDFPGKNTVQGWRRSHSWAKEHDVYFYAEFSEDAVSVEVADSATVRLHFAPGCNRPLKVKIALSSVSCANAKANLLAELPQEDWNFKRLRSSARKAWNEYLGRIEIKDKKADLRSFYTALYHTAMHPSLYSDCNGQYRGMDRKVHTARGYDRYTVFSVWDVFRACFPLYCMIARDRMPDFLRSALEIYRECGSLPKWELSGNETNTMIGYNAVSIIADAWAKGLVPRESLHEYYEAMLGTANRPDNSHDLFKKYEFIPADEDDASVSKTLEFAYDAWCVAQVAGALGRTEDYELFIRRAQYWKNVFDAGSGFMRPREIRQWAPDFTPVNLSSHFTEANSWQYSFFTPHDIAGHIAALGGQKAYTDKLDSLFAASSEGDGSQLQDVTGLIGQYAHGNEPSHHVAYLYDYAGMPFKTQALTRSICRNFYFDAPDGLCGNEDCGQMSAWYVLSALGMYSVTPGTTTMALTSPLMRKAVVHTGAGRFTVTADNTDKTFIASATLDGRPYGDAVLDFSHILRGGHLAFRMSDEPSRWGARAVAVPSIEEKYRYDAVFPEDFGKCSNAVGTPAMHAHPNTPYHHSYTAGGDDGLVDGIRGKLNWRVKGWQGYRGTEVDIVVDLLAEKEISSVTVGLLQDMNNYIWMPGSIDVYTSVDGVNYNLAGSVKSEVAIDEPRTLIQDWTVSFDSTPARYVRVCAHPFGEIPSWHRGYGDKSFIFIDEIMINNTEN